MQPARIGPYVVERELGRGGAGIVYLATDSTLDRQVAIKALPAAVAADPETLRRFEREAKTVAALNQRNIAAIHDLETVGETRYLILEYVEGESIDRLLERGPLPIADALDCARQVADGLEAAHEKGIVHRDLKPANLRRRPDGVVKILDFGLAKAVGVDGVSDDSLLNITSESAIVGTPAYLSPEQAQGRSVDRRTDVWGFGCTLFELLTARKAFAANTLADLLRRILEEEPDYGALPVRTPPRVRELLERCLVKDPRERLRDIGDARIELERALGERAWTGPIAVGARTRTRPWSRLWPYAAAAVVGAAGYALWSRDREPLTAAPRHTSIHVAGGGDLTIARCEPSFRISPDGRIVAFAGEPGSTADVRARTRRLYLRRLDDFEVRAVEQSDKVMSFAFSPDSAWLCMVVPLSAESSTPMLMKVRVDGSAPPVLLAPWSDSRVLWLADGTIISSIAPIGTLRRVAAVGGVAREVTVAVEGVEPAYRFELQRQLPGDRGVTISVPTYGPQGYELHLGILDVAAARARLLLRDAGAGAWFAGGHLLFTRHDRLLAIGCDLPSGGSRGDPVVIAEGLRTDVPWQHAWFDLADDGTLLYQPGGVQGAGRRLALVSADGRTTDWSGDRLAFDESVNVSLDGKRLVVTRTGPGGLYEVWGSELDPPRLRPIAVSPQSDCGFGVLSRGGDFVIFDRVGRDRPAGILRMPFDGSSLPTLVHARSEGIDMLIPMAIAPDDGSFLFWQEAVGGSSLWLLSLRDDDAGSRAPALVAEMATSPRSGGFSPDGRWIVYISDISGRQTVYVRRFETGTVELGPPIPVPLLPDRTPEYVYWAKTLTNGAPELLISYRRSLQRIDAVRLLAAEPVRFSMAQPRFQVGGNQWVWDDGLPDGRILAIVRGPEESTGDRLHLVTGWFAELAAVLGSQPR